MIFLPAMQLGVAAIDGKRVLQLSARVVGFDLIRKTNDGDATTINNRRWSCMKTKMLFIDTDILVSK